MTQAAYDFKCSKEEIPVVRLALQTIYEELSRRIASFDGTPGELSHLTDSYGNVALFIGIGSAWRIEKQLSQFGGTERFPPARMAIDWLEWAAAEIEATGGEAADDLMLKDPQFKRAIKAAEKALNSSAHRSLCLGKSKKRAPKLGRKPK